MKDFTVLGREEDSGKYIVKEIKAHTEIEAKDIFLDMFDKDFVRVQRLDITNTSPDKTPKLYDVVEIVWPKFYDTEDGKLEARTEFLGATGVVTDIYDSEQDKHMTHPFFVEFSADFDHLNDGLGELWQKEHLQLLIR